MKNYLFLLVLIFAPGFVFGAGFVPDSIWLSHDNPTDGEVVDIYVTVFNSETSNLSGDIRYYDDNLLLGEIPVIVSSNSAKLVTLSWEATQGDKIIYAQFTPDSGALEETKKLRFRVKKPFIPEPEKVAEVVEVSDESSSSESGHEQSSFQEFASSAGETTVRIAEDGFEYAEEGRDSTLGTLESGRSNLQDKKEVLLSGGVDGVDSQFKYDTRKAYLSILIWLLTALIFITSSKILFYLVIVLAIYYIIRLIQKRRNAYND